MDASQNQPTPESQPTPSTGESLAANKLEAKAPPAAAEAAQAGPKKDDGVASAQSQVASVGADDSVSSDPAVPPTPPPVKAADVDVIEPEWVKKAEAAVAKHRDDPHAEEDAVEDLQRIYLKERYGLDVKASDDRP